MQYPLCVPALFLSYTSGRAIFTAIKCTVLFFFPLVWCHDNDRLTQMHKRTARTIVDCLFVLPLFCSLRKYLGACLCTIAATSGKRGGKRSGLPTVHCTWVFTIIRREEKRHKRIPWTTTIYICYVFRLFLLISRSDVGVLLFLAFTDTYASTYAMPPLLSFAKACRLFVSLIQISIYFFSPAYAAFPSVTQWWSGRKKKKTFC